MQLGVKMKQVQLYYRFLINRFILLCIRHPNHRLMLTVSVFYAGQKFCVSSSCVEA